MLLRSCTRFFLQQILMLSQNRSRIFISIFYVNNIHGCETQLLSYRGYYYNHLFGEKTLLGSKPNSTKSFPVSQTTPTQKVARQQSIVSAPAPPLLGQPCSSCSSRNTCTVQGSAPRSQRLPEPTNITGGNHVIGWLLTLLTDSSVGCCIGF